MGDLGLVPESDSPDVKFHIWPQDIAQIHLITLLATALPNSIPVYNRILAPHNTPSQHCLFASSIPPSTISCSLPETWTVIFSDRSRSNEAQIWLYNHTIAEGKAQTSQQKRFVQQHVTSAFHFIKNAHIPSAPGWPFSPFIRFDRTQTEVADALVALCTPHRAVEWDTNWTRYNIPLSSVPPVPSLPDGLRYVSPVPESQLDLVISTSSIPRQKATLMSLPSSCIVDGDGNAVAWVWCGLDGSLATLFVVEAWRSRGLAKAVSADLLHKIRDGYAFSNLEEYFVAGSWERERDEFRMPFGKGSGYMFAEIKIGNTPSEKTMEWLGGTKWGMSRYVFIDTSKVPAGATME